jgi:hypothetical protein
MISETGNRPLAVGEAMSEFHVHEAGRKAFATASKVLSRPMACAESEYEFAFCSGYEYAVRQAVAESRKTATALSEQPHNDVTAASDDPYYRLRIMRNALTVLKERRASEGGEAATIGAMVADIDHAIKMNRRVDAFAPHDSSVWEASIRGMLEEIDDDERLINEALNIIRTYKLSIERSEQRYDALGTALDAERAARQEHESRAETWKRLAEEWRGLIDKAEAAREKSDYCCSYGGRFGRRSGGHDGELVGELVRLARYAIRDQRTDGWSQTGCPDLPALQRDAGGRDQAAQPYL